MNTTPKMSLEEENTARLISRANRLGYMVETIDPDRTYRPITIRPASLEDYTPELYFNDKTGWTCQTMAYGAKTIDEIQLIAEGYARAVAMIRELDTATDLAPHTID
ncbi:hypothetical protein ACU19_02990 [Actinobaculum suis]|uniref:hypothetical protein n=1 Tax=Actinobaculum suis TaxID=1657 RepID=UPI00066FEC63|nr:hypothetical protein [Actinobaculum suis]KMY23641.1 hypothetical protein ACU19_02990 [Actinobaculum suis]